MGPVVFPPVLLQLLGQLMHLLQLHQAAMLVQDLLSWGHLDEQGALAPRQLPELAVEQAPEMKSV